MTKRKTTATELAKTSRQAGKPSAALPVGYANLLADLKARVRAAQLRAAVSVNRELTLLYWDIGKIIVEAQNTKGYGKQVVEQLAEDLHTAFPKMDGFSPRNVWRMRAFYLAWTDESQKHQQPAGNLDSKILPQLVAELDGQNLPQAVAEIPWGHNVWLLEKISNPILRLWYAHKTIEHGWSRAVLTHHIETQLHKREGKAVTNFKRTLPPPQSDLAEQTLKDPYNFDFLTLHSDAHERDLENGLLDHIQKFLLELGVGFAFVGRQYHMEISGQDYYLDLLFYHLRLRCYIVIDLLCGRPHKRSSVADFIMWPCQRKSRAFGETKVWRRHIKRDYRLRRNSIKSLSSRHFTRDVVRPTSQRANALAFISKSTSA
jgi:predicted nuclease of restriction endonuclease-like (RecB) superfamily